MTDRLEVCILAAGLGKRMKSAKPKVLHPVAGRPMLAHLLDSVASLAPQRVHVVIGRGADEVRTTFADRPVNWVLQAEQRGTGHAVMQVMPHVDAGSKLLILLGDAPLVRSETMRAMIDEPCDLGVLTVRLENPFNYGRIVRGEGRQILRIVEERDATEDERRISEINTGVMVADAERLSSWLSRLDTDNDQGEYLLTDIVTFATNDGLEVHAIETLDVDEAKGVNNLEQLAALERALQRRRAVALMAAGARLADPERIDIRGEVRVGSDVGIDVNCIFEGDCQLGDNVRIGPNCTIADSRVGSNVEIRANSVIEGATIEDDCVVGPFARLRPETRMAPGSAVGNFVEVKKSTIGAGTKASHLAYLGDAVIGAGVNIGAGTITCNYDGVDKHVTTIEDNVFVGSNAALVAPVTIGEGSTIAAGSTITKNVEDNRLAIARGRQKTIADWKGPGKD